LLYQEKIIEKIPKDFYYNKIKNKDSNLFAAFQVFSVTKNHLDFAETLKTIYNNEINENNGNNNKNSNNNNNNKDDGKNKLKKLLDEILLDKQFTDGEREIAIEEFNEQNNMLLSVLQSHDPDEYEDTVSRIKMICEKSIKKNSRKL
jgi:predicted MPP superfamily phosphohydrolase